MGRNPPGRGVHPVWITFLLAFFSLSLATGFFIVSSANYPFPLGGGQFSFVRLRWEGTGVDLLTRSAVVILVTPAFAVSVAPPALLLHLLGLSAVLTLAIEGLARGDGRSRVVLAAGLAFAFLTPMPGLYGYPNPWQHVITLFPRLLVPIVLFFHTVRFLFPVLAYGLPVLAWVLAGSPKASRPRPRPPRLSPATLLPAAMFGGMLLVLSGRFLLQLVGLLLNWAVPVAALFLWALYYRPRTARLVLPDRPTRIQQLLTRWRNPAAAFVGFAIVILLLTAFPPVDTYLEASAPGHHLQHVLLFAAGLFQGGIVWQQARAFRPFRGLWGELARFAYTGNMLYNPRGLVGILFAAASLGFWHAPPFWDLAVQNDVVHVVEHFFVIAAGAAVATSLFRMRRSAQYLLLMVAMAVASLLSISLWFAPFPVYATYGRADLALLGLLHFVLGMPVMIYALGRGAASLRNAPAPPGVA